MLSSSDNLLQDAYIYFFQESGNKFEMQFPF